MRRGGIGHPGCRGRTTLVSIAVLAVLVLSFPVTRMPEVAISSMHPVAPAGRTLVAAPVALGGPADLGGFALAGEPAPNETVTTTVTLSQPMGASSLRAYLEAQGLSVRDPDGMVIWLVSGPIRAFDSAFDTTLMEYHGSGGRTDLAFTRTPSVPTGLPVAALAPPDNTMGLTQAIREEGPVASLSPRGLTPPCWGHYAGVLNSSQVQKAYNITPVLAAGDEGAGETLGIVDVFDSAEPPARVSADLDSFSMCSRLASPDLEIAYPVPSPDQNSSPSSGWGLEVALDTQWAHATAPGAKILLALSPNSAYGLYFSVDWLVAGERADVISLSWGEPETGIYNLGPCSFQCNASSDGSFATMGPVFAQAASLGIDIFVASGDCGANGGTPAFTPWYPSSDPHAIGVGGTVLNLDSQGGYGSESAWNGTETLCGNGGGSGGGFSTLPRPWWQHGPGFGRFANVTRGVPDVALTSGVPLGMIYNGSTVFVEGTSDAAPQWAGMGAIIGEVLGKGPPGFLAPSFYDLLDSSGYSTDFHDVTEGNNGFVAGPGWDPLTGVGTPDFANLVKSLTTSPPVRIAGTQQLTLNASPLAGVAPEPWEPLPVNLSVTPRTGGEIPARYQYYLGDVGTPYQESNSTVTTRPWLTVPYAKAGAYVAFAVGYGADGNTSMSNPLVINVGNAGPLGANLTASPQRLNASDSVTFQAGATGGTGPYHYAYFFGDGTYESSWGQQGPSIVHTYSANGTYLVTTVVNDSSVPLRGGWATACIVVGNSSEPCPTVPRLVEVSLAPTRSTLVAGTQGNGITVTVTHEGAPLAGATVFLGSSRGSFAVPVGITDGSGSFSTTYTAPDLTQTLLFPLYANVSMPGFAEGLGEALIVVNPVTGPSLVSAITPDQANVLSRASDGITIQAGVAVTGQIVKGARLHLATDEGSLHPSEGTVNAQGFFTTELVAPNSSVVIHGNLTATVSYAGYTTSSTQRTFAVLPGTGALEVSVSLNHTTLPSMASSGVDVNLRDPGGGISQERIGGLAATSTAGGYSLIMSPSPGQYSLAYSAPSTRMNTTTILSFNVTNPAGALILGSNVAMVNVTWGHGYMRIGLNVTGPLIPDHQTNLTVTISSAATGFPLANTLVVVNINKGVATPNVGWTDAWGHMTLPFTETLSNGTLEFSIMVIGFAYRLTTASFNITLSSNQPSTLPYGDILLPVAALGVSFLGIVFLLPRRKSKAPFPTGPPAEHPPPFPGGQNVKAPAEV